jgi:hypothetical protein
MRLLLIAALLPVGGYLWSKLFSYARGWAADLKPGWLRDLLHCEIF